MNKKELGDAREYIEYAIQELAEVIEALQAELAAGPAGDSDTSEPGDEVVEPDDSGVDPLEMALEHAIRCYDALGELVNIVEPAWQRYGGDSSGPNPRERKAEQRLGVRSDRRQLKLPGTGNKPVPSPKKEEANGKSHERPRPVRTARRSIT